MKLYPKEERTTTIFFGLVSRFSPATGYVCFSICLSHSHVIFSTFLFVYSLLETHRSRSSELPAFLPPNVKPLPSWKTWLVCDVTWNPFSKKKMRLNYSNFFVAFSIHTRALKQNLLFAKQFAFRWGSERVQLSFTVTRLTTRWFANKFSRSNLQNSRQPVSIGSVSWRKVKHRIRKLKPPHWTRLKRDAKSITRTFKVHGLRGRTTYSIHDDSLWQLTRRNGREPNEKWLCVAIRLISRWTGSRAWQELRRAYRLGSDPPSPPMPAHFCCHGFLSGDQATCPSNFGPQLNWFQRSWRGSDPAAREGGNSTRGARTNLGLSSWRSFKWIFRREEWGHLHLHPLTWVDAPSQEWDQFLRTRVVC